MSVYRKKNALTFGVLGLICLLGLCFEFVVILFEQFVYDKTYYQFTITESITHWLIVSGLWGILGLVLFYVSARVYGFNFSKKKNLPSKRGRAICGLMFCIAFGLKFYVYGGWKPMIDFRSSGWFQFIFQYIYYLFQAFIIQIMIVFAQECVEKILRARKIKLKHIPWGGIILAVTWGIIHTVTELSLPVALCYIVLSLLIGGAHLAANKNIYISYVLTILILLV